MPYHLQNTQLRVVRSMVRQERNAPLRNTRMIMLEHILPTTAEYVAHLRDVGVEIHTLLGKPYSIDSTTFSNLSEAGVNIKRISYKQLEETDYINRLLDRAIFKSKKDNKPILILDVGGYFAKPLSQLDQQDAGLFAGVVEDTTYGHNRYLRMYQEIPIPVFSVARSSLKEIEARFVGRDGVAAVESVLRDLGVSISGRHALVIGYGMIGSNVARTLRNHDLIVQVYDREDFKNLRAFIDGFFIHKKRELIRTADLIFAATADRALSFTEIEECKSHVILASVGSKDTEYEVDTLKSQAIAATSIGKHIVKYDLANGKSIMLLRDGTAVNFMLPSLPVEILDLVFSEILVCALLLLKRKDDFPAKNKVYQSPDTNLSAISKDWLRFVNVG